MQIPHSPAKQVAAFLHCFGDDSDSVTAEIEGLWREAGHFLPPPELYARLIDSRVKKGLIHEKRGEFLKAYVEECFYPETVTGYYPRPRLPLVEGLAALYTERFPKRPLYHIAGDISNLGGLNDAVPNRARADRIYGALTEHLRHTLDEIGNVVPVRSGGDELTIIFSPNPGIGPKRIRQQITRFQTELCEFLKDAGLDAIPHPKYKDRFGLGIGIDIEEMHSGTALEIEQRLQPGIERSKQQLYALLHSGNPPTPAYPTPATVDAALERNEHAKHRPQERGYYSYVFGDPTPGTTPNEARLRFLRRHLADVTLSRTSPIERHILHQTATTMQTRDPATGLPMFGNMQGEMLPHFMEQQPSLLPGEPNHSASPREEATNAMAGALYGLDLPHNTNSPSQFRLAHIDFNNLSAGNQLGHWVGHSMNRTYASVVTSALRDSGLGALRPYLTTQNGGKFALLVPASLSPESERWQAFEAQLAIHLEKVSHQPLALSDDIRAIATTSLTSYPELRKLYGEQGQKLGKNGNIEIAHLINPKSKLPGTQMTVLLSQPHDYDERPLGELMKSLEFRAEIIQKGQTKLRQWIEQPTAQLSQNEQPIELQGRLSGVNPPHTRRQ